MLKTLVQQSTSGGAPSATAGDTQRAIEHLAENKMARLLGRSGLKWTQQCEISSLWLDVLAQPDEESRQVFLQMDFSIAKTKEPGLLFQTTEKMEKDLSKLHLSQVVESNYDASHHGNTPISVTPLATRSHRE